MPSDIYRKNDALPPPPLQNKSRDQGKRIPAVRAKWLNLSSKDVPFFWFEQSVLNQALSLRLGLLHSIKTTTEVPITYLVYASKYDQEWDDAWRHTERLLLEIRRVSISMGARFAIVSASTPQGVHGAKEGLKLLVNSFPAMSEHSFDLACIFHQAGRYNESYHFNSKLCKTFW